MHIPGLAQPCERLVSRLGVAGIHHLDERYFTAFLIYDGTLGPVGRIIVGSAVAFVWLGILRVVAKFLRYRMMN